MPLFPPTPSMELVLRPRNPPSQPTTEASTSTPSHERSLALILASPSARPEPLEGRLPPVNLVAKNRRKRYLDLNPSYFDEADLELANPLLYDQLIRRFQTTAEREEHGRRTKGAYYANYLRRQARQDAILNPDPHAMLAYNVVENGNVLAETDEDRAELERMGKEEARSWWVDEMTQRFLMGRAKEFDYSRVDDNDRFDHPEAEWDRWEKWADEGDEEEEEDEERVLTGETGIDDY